MIKRNESQSSYYEARPDNILNDFDPILPFTADMCLVQKLRNLRLRRQGTRIADGAPTQSIGNVSDNSIVSDSELGELKPMPIENQT